MSKNYWDSELYDGGHGYISRYGLDLIDLLDPQPGEKILDAGCATGDICSKVAEVGAEVIGIDNSSDMIAKARSKYPRLTFTREDIVLLPFRGEFDGVISNAVLHWVKGAEAALTSIHASLKPGGRFVAEMGGKNNIATIVSAIYRALDQFGYPSNKANYPWVFFSVGEYAPMIERCGFVIREMIYFDRFTELSAGEEGLKDWLDMFGDIFFRGIPEFTMVDIYSFIQDEVRDVLYRNGKWWADYKRLRIRVEKPVK